MVVRLKKRKYKTGNTVEVLTAKIIWNMYGLIQLDIC